MLITNAESTTSVWLTVVTVLPPQTALPMKNESAGSDPVVFLVKLHDSASEFESLANVI